MGYFTFNKTLTDVNQTIEYIYDAHYEPIHENLMDYQTEQMKSTADSMGSSFGGFSGGGAGGGTTNI